MDPKHNGLLELPSLASDLDVVATHAETPIQSITASVVIPVRNALPYANRLIRALKRQTRQAQRVIIIDSESTDGSPERFRQAGFTVVTIKQKSFDHGATRNLGWRMCDTDVVMFLTQDTLPHDRECFAQLLDRFENPSVGIVGGRQLPRIEARAIERHGRLFNYPATSNTRTLADAPKFGFKVLSNSNAFSAYRRALLEGIDGFPTRIIMGEDHVAVARALLKGWTIVYDGNAVVEHSHGYSLMEEFGRYFDIGVAHKYHAHIYKMFAMPDKEGKRFVLSELRYLWQHTPLRIPEAMLRTIIKLVAYRLGHREQLLPPFIRNRVAMNPQYFSALWPPNAANISAELPITALLPGDPCES